MKYLKLFNESFSRSYAEVPISGIDELSNKELRNHKYIIMSGKVKKILKESIKYYVYYSGITKYNKQGYNTPGFNYKYTFLSLTPNDRDIDILDEYFDFERAQCTIDIIEMEDEWFRVDFNISFGMKKRRDKEIKRIFICDQLDGLMDLLKNQRLLK